MGRTDYNKLVRDFIPEKIRSAGDSCEIKTLTAEEFIPALLSKIVEEAKELEQAKTRNEILSEYADLMTALDAFTAHHEFSEADIKEALGRNIEKKGLFKEHYFLEWTEDKN